MKTTTCKVCKKTGLIVVASYDGEYGNYDVGLFQYDKKLNIYVKHSCQFPDKRSVWTKDQVGYELTEKVQKVLYNRLLDYPDDHEVNS